MKDREKENFYETRFSQKWKPAFHDLARIKIVLQLVGSNKKVLDIGCYDGAISTMIKDLGNEVFGVDISTKAVSMAQKKGIKAIKVSDIENGLPFSDGSFDVVVAGEIIEHIFDTDSFLDEIYRVLNKKGSLILTTPNLASLGSRITLFIGRQPWTVETSLKDESAGHIRHFTYQTLRKLLELHRLKVDVFTSSVISFAGKIITSKLAKLFPRLGLHLIIKARKVEEDG